MSAPRFTPGPWRAVPYGTRLYIEDANGRVIAEMRPDTTRLGFDGAQEPTLSASAVAEANAIVRDHNSAPELYAACEAIVRFKDSLPADQQGAFFALSTWDDLRAALRAARGEP